MSSVAVTPSTVSLPRCAQDLRAHIESSLGEHLSSTLRLQERAAPTTVPTGIAAIDALTQGLPRAALTEIAGPTSSGRTGVMLSALAAATRRQEVCALVDASDSFDPCSAAVAGIDLERLLWVRCNQAACATKRTRAKYQNSAFAFAGVLEQVLKVTDLLLQSGGFGMVVLDMGDIPAESVRRIPLTSWYRFRRAVEPTATVLLLIEQEPSAKTCASLVLQLQPEALCASNPSVERPFSTQQELQFSSPATKSAPALGSKNRLTYLQQGNVGRAVRSENYPPPHAMPLRGMRFRAEVVRSWANRKPPQSAGANFELRTAL
jgi:hypothetical protein